MRNHVCSSSRLPSDKTNKQPICGRRATSLIHTRSPAVNQRMTYFISTFYVVFEVVLILRVKFQHPVKERRKQTRKLHVVCFSVPNTLLLMGCGILWKAIISFGL